MIFLKMILPSQNLCRGLEIKYTNTSSILIISSDNFCSANKLTKYFLMQQYYLLSTSQKTIHSQRDIESEYYHFDHAIVILQIIYRYAQENTDVSFNTIYTHE